MQQPMPKNLWACLVDGRTGHRLTADVPLPGSITDAGFELHKSVELKLNRYDLGDQVTVMVWIGQEGIVTPFAMHGPYDMAPEECMRIDRPIRSRHQEVSDAAG